MTGITKAFGSVVANDSISLRVAPGEVHALLGENGAGKTTLMNILYGLYPPDSGQIRLNGDRVAIHGASEAIRLGIGMVHQHFKLVDTFTVAQNIVLGRERVGAFGILRDAQAVEAVVELSAKFGLRVDPLAVVRDVSVGTQQRVEILKALYRRADVLILDEPTAVLTPQEIDELMDIMRLLVDQGTTIILITHKLREIIAIADRCTVIRRGKVVDTVDVGSATPRSLASAMVGREVLFTVDRKTTEPGDVRLAIDGLVVRNARGLAAVNGASLSVRSGEIVGVAGVDGNGQSELVEALVGVRRVESGRILVDQTDVTGMTPKSVQAHGLASIPEDRQRRGLVLEYSIADNMVMGIHDRAPYSRGGILNEREIHRRAAGLIERFDVRPNDPEYPAGSLSGGNQQKVIIAREVGNDPNVLVAAQPTRGLDVGAIEFVHRALVEQRDRGKAVLLISLDLDEVMNLSDRIAVIYEGKIVGIFERGRVDEHHLGLLMAGGRE